MKTRLFILCAGTDKVDNAVKELLKISGEDHTLGNILQDMFLQDKRVKGAGFIVTHPLKKEVVMTVFLEEGERDPLLVVEEGIEKLKIYLNNIKRIGEKT